MDVLRDWEKLFGREEPTLGYLTGRTLKSLNETILFDSDLEPIRDEELYEISTAGIHAVSD